MNNSDKFPELSHLPPHVRTKMRERVEVVRRYVTNKSRSNAEASASRLGLSMVHFKKLARLWELHGDVDRLPGADWPKTKSIATTTEQLEVIAAAIAACPEKTIAEITREATAIARAKGVQLPSRNTISARIKELQEAPMRAKGFGHDCDIVITQAALNVPVAYSDAAVMPVAALAIHPPTRVILGLAIGLEMTARLAAEALVEALTRLPMSSIAAATQGPLRIAMDILPGDAWHALAETMNKTRTQLVGGARKVPRRDVAAAYLGKEVKGIDIYPRLALKPACERQPYVESGQASLTLEEAKTFAAARMIPIIRPVADGDAALGLRTALLRWLDATARG